MTHIEYEEIKCVILNEFSNCLTQIQKLLNTYHPSENFERAYYHTYQILGHHSDPKILNQHSFLDVFQYCKDEIPFLRVCSIVWFESF